MHSSNLVLSFLLALRFSFTTASIVKDFVAPPGYQQGYATVSLLDTYAPPSHLLYFRISYLPKLFPYGQQDHEPAGQKSICQTGCKFPGDNSGTPDMKPGVFAAAIGPQLGGDSSNCMPCGACYSIINSGNPYCKWDDGNCPVATGPDNQEGPKEIKVMIVNHCMDCGEVPGHFDINNSPGWNNPQIWWKPLDPSECR
ncbi:MAG: hypothetical protein L6R39_000011 [Caloplaca ligustica]|nr:MAG: hypothetical protein L6R39_000011 [Caloplaca ligustica]